MSPGAAHDVELAQPAWPLVRDLEEQMVSAVEHTMELPDIKLEG